MGADPKLDLKGPFLAEQLRSGDPYELSEGHSFYCLPTGGRGSSANAVGVLSLRTDPAVTSAGVDTGFAPEPDMLRAPDIAVGNVPNEPGWVKGAPPLAVEYADEAQDEDSLQRKIVDLQRNGTRHVWVVRLSGPRRVEVYDRDKAMTIALPGAELRAPGILANAVRVDELYDPEAAMEAALRNLLQRKGYASLEGVKAESEAKGKAKGEARGRAEGKAEGEAKGRAEAIVTVLRARGLAVDADTERRLFACTELARLDEYTRRAVTVAATEELFGAS